jgi:hypothetical protein
MGKLGVCLMVSILFCNVSFIESSENNGHNFEPVFLSGDEFKEIDEVVLNDDQNQQSNEIFLGGPLERSPLETLLASMAEDEMKPPTLASIGHDELIVEEHPYHDLED